MVWTKLIDGKDIKVRIYIFKFNYYIFILKENGNPAPNAYVTDKVLMGNIYNSKFRSGHYITMSKRLKKCGYKNDYPGPGSYLRFSQFGILVPKKQKRGYSAFNTMPNKNRKDKYETVKTEDNRSVKRLIKKFKKEIYIN